MKKTIVAGAVALLAATVAYTYDVHHPNLKEAHAAINQAISHLQDAAAANRAVGFGGHAERAEDLLKQAEAEVIAADQYNYAHQKR